MMLLKPHRASSRFLAGLAALALVPWTFARLTQSQRVATILIVAVLVCSGLIFVPASSWKRLSTIPKEFAWGTLDERTVVWQAGWEVFREHPFRGVGAGALWTIGICVGTPEVWTRLGRVVDDCRVAEAHPS